MNDPRENTSWSEASQVAEYIRKTKPDATGVLYLEGQKTRMIEDNDESAPFRYSPINPPSSNETNDK